MTSSALSPSEPGGIAARLVSSIGYLSRVAIRALVTAVVVALATFFLVRAVPGDPVREILGEQAPPQAVAALRHQLGLDQSLPHQLASFLSGLLHGNLGMSLQFQGTSVDSLVLKGLGQTIVLALAAMILATIVAVVLGLTAAATKLRWLDWLVRALALVALSFPAALSGILAILLAAVALHIAPAGGWGHGYPENFRYLWLPTVSLAAVMIPTLLRVVRQQAEQVLSEAHVEAAIARGAPPRVVLVQHVLPNSVLPLITIVGLSVGNLMSGAVVIEAVFAIPGLGSALSTAATARDYPVIQGAAIVCAIVVVIANSLAEIAQHYIDPRARV